MKRLDFRDPHTMALQYSIETPQCAGINHADLSIDGRFVIFTCEYQGSLTKIDVVDRKVLGYLTLSRGGMPQDIYASRDGTKLYIANRGSSVPPAHRTASRSTHRDSENRFERARGQCEDCGLHVGRSGWIRHKTSPGMTCDEYNDLDNLALLCPPCHRRAPHARGGVATPSANSRPKPDVDDSPRRTDLAASSGAASHPEAASGPCPHQPCLPRQDRAGRAPRQPCPPCPYCPGPPLFSD